MKANEEIEYLKQENEKLKKDYKKLEKWVKVISSWKSFRETTEREKNKPKEDLV
jgi:hypothetical protein